MCKFVVVATRPNGLRSVVAHAASKEDGKAFVEQLNRLDELQGGKGGVYSLEEKKKKQSEEKESDDAS